MGKPTTKEEQINMRLKKNNIVKNGMADLNLINQCHSKSQKNQYQLRNSKNKQNNVSSVPSNNLPQDTGIDISKTPDSAELQLLRDTLKEQQKMIVEHNKKIDIIMKQTHKTASKNTTISNITKPSEEIITADTDDESEEAEAAALVEKILEEKKDAACRANGIKLKEQRLKTLRAKIDSKLRLKEFKAVAVGNQTQAFWSYKAGNCFITI